MDLNSQLSDIPSDDDTFWDAACSMAKKQNTADEKKWEYYVKIFRDGEFQEGQGASSNHTFADVSLLMAVLYAQDPNIEVAPRSDGDLPSFQQLVPMLFPDPLTAQEKYADILEKVLDFNWSETKSSVHANAALFEGIVRGMGVVKHCFDQERGSSTLDALHRHEVYIDGSARNHLDQADYVIQTCVLPLEKARNFFKSVGYPAYMQLEANFRLVEQTGLAGDFAKESSPTTDQPTHLKFFEIWDKRGGIKGLYYRFWDKPEFIFKRDWPFMLGRDEFPYSLLVFNTQYMQVHDAFSDLHVVNGLRSTYERVIEFYRTHVKRCLATKVIYDKTAFDDPKINDLLNSKDMKFIPANLGGRKAEDVIQKINFTEDADMAINLAGHLKQIKDEVFGIDDIQRGTAKVLTATQSKIQDSYGKARIGRRQKLLDEFLTDVVNKRAKIDIQLMPVERVARISGQMDAMVWQAVPFDPEELQCLYSIKITAGSTGEQMKAEQIDRFQKLFDRANALNQTQMMPIFDVTKILLKLLELDGIPHPERWLMAPLQPKLPMPGQGMPPGQEPQQGGMEAQVGPGEANSFGVSPPDQSTTAGGPQPQY